MLDSWKAGLGDWWKGGLMVWLGTLEREPMQEDWEKEYTASALHREFVAKRLENAPANSSLLNARPVPAEVVRPRPAVQMERPRRLFLHQFLVLTARYAELVWKDRRSLRLLLLQAPIVALFILLGFVNKPYRPADLARAARAALDAPLSPSAQAGVPCPR